MASSNVDRSKSNIYLDDPDFYHQNHNSHFLQSQFSKSTMNMPLTIDTSTFASPSSSSSSMLKGAVSMQQLKDSSMKMNARPTNRTEQRNMIMDQNQSTLSIPDINEQQLMNERLMCIQQLIDSGQNFTSMFNDDPYFAQRMMSYMTSTNQYEQQGQEPEVIEIMDE